MQRAGMRHYRHTAAVSSCRLRLVAGVLAVALDHDHVVVLVQAYVDGRPVGLGHLDLVGRAVLSVGLDAVGRPTARRLKCLRAGARLTLVYWWLTGPPSPPAATATLPAPTARTRLG
jgi:hypothetical protein